MISLFSVAVVMAATWANAGPTVTVVTDRGGYCAGETIELSLGGENYDEPMSVDVYVGLVGHDGALYTLSQGGWGAFLEPWMSDLFVPDPFYMAPVPFQWFNIPCVMPPIGEQGEYSFAAGLTHPGTLEFVSEISFAPFEVFHGPPTDYYVDAELGDDDNDGSGNSPWRRICHALSSVRGTEATPVTIHVAAGTYSYTTNGEAFPLHMRDYVSLSGDDRETTILDGRDIADNIISCIGDEGVSIERFTITGGNADNEWPYSGGGIFCEACSPIIRANTINANSADFDGGGIYCEDGSPVIEDNMITNNFAKWGRGGGIYCEADSSAKIIRNTITGNSAEENGAGILYDRE